MDLTITATCDSCGLNVADDATDDRPCPNCSRGTLVVLAPQAAKVFAEPSPEDAAWDALDEDDQLAILEYLEALDL